MKILGQLSTTNYTITSASYAGNAQPYLASGYTVTFSSSMSTSQMQSMIDAQPKNLNGNALTFQFSDGTYRITEALAFNNFYGGILTIVGNASENAYALHTNQTVIISGSSTAGNIHTNNNYSQVAIRNLRIWNSSSISWLISGYANKTMDISGNYLLGATGTGYAIRLNQCYGYVSNNYITRTYGGVVAETCAVIASENNSTQTTTPAYGLITNYAGVIGKIGTQPGGSSAAENSTLGGTIR